MGKVIGDVLGKIINMLEDLMLRIKKNFFVTFDDLIKDWEKFYKDVFDIEVDLSQVVIPKKRKGFNQLIIVIFGMTPQILFNKCQEKFDSWKYTNQNLDEIVISERIAKDKPYAIWIRDRIEADEELKFLSTNDLKKKKNFLGITLEERELYELKYFQKNGKHLDVQNITLCLGSVASDGSVFTVHCHEVKLKVCHAHPECFLPTLRAREVVVVA